MQGSYIVTGVLTDKQTVKLDEPVPLSPMKVRVMVEPLRSRGQRPYIEVMAEIREGQHNRGHRPPTPDQVARYLRAERESWGE